MGIGTVTPINKLDVNGTMAVGSYAGTSTAPSNSLIVSGNIGIGTNSPATKLVVGSDAAGVGTNYDNAQLRIAGTADPLERTVIGYDTTSNYGVIASYISPSTYSPLAINPLGGNVGIGTTSPTSKLTVLASGDCSRQLRSSNRILCQPYDRRHDRCCWRRRHHHGYHFSRL